MEKMCRPSTIGLLKAYNMKKLRWPMQNKLSRISIPPTVPPKDYAARDLPSLPGVTVPPPRRKRSITELQNVDTSQSNYPDTQSDAYM